MARARIGALLIAVAGAALTAVIVVQRHDPTPRELPPQSNRSGSVAMAKRLADIADAADTVGLEQAAGMVFGTNQPHLIPVLQRMVGEAADPIENFALRVRLAAQLLQAGFSKEALQELEVRVGERAASGDSTGDPGCERPVDRVGRRSSCRRRRSRHSSTRFPRYFGISTFLMYPLQSMSTTPTKLTMRIGASQ